MFNVTHAGDTPSQPSPATPAPGPQSQIVLERLYHADFRNRVRARYPSTAEGVHVKGWVNVLIHVDGSGKPLNADVLKSSDNAPLDKSALAAALSSTYRLHQRKDGSIDSHFYTASYEFTPEAP